MTSRIVIVTGASSGIGEATAKRYAESGARVLLLARDETRLEAVAAAIAKKGSAAMVYSINLADADATEALAARIARDHGSPHTIINNAGAGRWLPLLDTTPAEALRMLQVPYLAAFTLTRAFLPHMLARKEGRIAFVSSPASYLAWPNAAAYIAARRAVAGLADGLRSEIRGSGLTVTLILLGTVDSPYWRHNPGSREHLPDAGRLMPLLSCEDAAEAIFAGTEAGKRYVVKPGLFRALFILNALFPRLVASRMARAAKPSPPGHA
jgi:short-subunit dehydrogenase